MSALYPGSTAYYVALHADPFEETYLRCPDRLDDARWAALVSRWLPDEAEELLSDEVIPRHAGQRVLDPGGDQSYGARALCACAVEECGRESWEGSDAETLSVLLTRFPPRAEALEPAAHAAWQALWGTFRHGGGPHHHASAQPWWIVRGYAGDYAALSSPAYLRDLTEVLAATGVVHAMERRLADAGFAEDARDLGPLVRFLEASAARGRWVLAVQSGA